MSSSPQFAKVLCSHNYSRKSVLNSRNSNCFSRYHLQPFTLIPSIIKLQSWVEIVMCLCDTNFILFLQMFADARVAQLYSKESAVASWWVTIIDISSICWTFNEKLSHLRFAEWTWLSKISYRKLLRGPKRSTRDRQWSNSLIIWSWRRSRLLSWRLSTLHRWSNRSSRTWRVVRNVWNLTEKFNLIIFDCFHFRACWNIWCICKLTNASVRYQKLINFNFTERRLRSTARLDSSQRKNDTRLATLHVQRFV